MNLYKRSLIALLVLLLLTGSVWITAKAVIPRQKTQRAMDLLSDGEFEEAYGILAELGKDEIIAGSIHARADALLEAGLRIPDDVRIVIWSNKGNEPALGVSLARLENDLDASADAVSDYVLALLAGRRRAPPRPSVG